MKNHNLGFLGISLAFAVVAFGCTAPAEKSEGKKSLAVKGSDTMVQLGQAWAEAFMKEHPDIQVSVTGGGSNTGIAALLNRGTDVCNASRQIKPEELEQAKQKGLDVKEFIVAQDALSVIVHPSNPVTELTLAQIKDIYTGKTTNWKELGGPDRPIVLNSRETSSGTYTFFTEHVLGKGVPMSEKAMLQPATSEIVRTVAQDAGGIGYVGLGYVTKEVKALRIKKDASAPAVEGTVANVLNKSYPLARPLYEYTAVEPTGVVKTWLDWVMSDKGQEIVKKLDFVPIK